MMPVEPGLYVGDANKKGDYSFTQDIFTRQIKTINIALMVCM